MLAKNVLYYGKDTPLPERRLLRAGPLSLVYEGGDLRYIRLGDRELWRRVYVAIRDRDWGTVPPQFLQVAMDIGDDSFHITYEARNLQGSIDFAWHADIAGDARGVISFSMQGEARTTFLRNRIGFCILHPANCAGLPCHIEHVDGKLEDARLPTHIVADQPVQPFSEMRALAHEAIARVWAEARFSGDIFEMEDQRNWTDASFKTFCTPLRLPFPVEIKAGTSVEQSLTLTLRDERPAAVRPRRRAGRRQRAHLTFAVDATSAAHPLPQLGLGVASHGQPLVLGEVSRLKALHLNHLRADLQLSSPNWQAQLALATGQARSLGADLELALLLSGDAGAELRRLRSALDRTKPPVGVWLVYPLEERDNRPSPTRELVSLARECLAGYDPAARFGAGTNCDYLLLALNPPPTQLLDLVCFAITPQVHASDNASLVETLEAQGMAVASTQRLAGGLPIAVSPVTLRQRFNPYATGPVVEPPPGVLPPTVDERQMSLLGAGWTAASLGCLAQSGADRVTYYETSGWRGVMESEKGSPLPDKFPSVPASVFPLYHVLADVGEFRGGEVIETLSSDALRVHGVALRKEGRVRVLLASMVREPQQVTVRGLGTRARMRTMDERNVEWAMRSPESYRALEGELVQPVAGTLELTLLPFAVVRLDVESHT